MRRRGGKEEKRGLRKKIAEGKKQGKKFVPIFIYGIKKRCV